MKKVLLACVNMYKHKRMQVLRYIVGYNLKLQHHRHVCSLQTLYHTYILIFVIYYCTKSHLPTFRNGASGVIGRDIALQDGWFRVRFPLRSLEIFKLPIAPVHIQWPWGSLQQE